MLVQLWRSIVHIHSAVYAAAFDGSHPFCIANTPYTRISFNDCYQLAGLRRSPSIRSSPTMTDDSLAPAVSSFAKPLEIRMQRLLKFGSVCMARQLCWRRLASTGLLLNLLPACATQPIAPAASRVAFVEAKPASPPQTATVAAGSSCSTEPAPGCNTCHITCPIGRAASCTPARSACAATSENCGICNRKAVCLCE